MKAKITFLINFLLVFVSVAAEAFTSISGQSPVMAGSTYIYTYDDGATHSSLHWTVPGTTVSTSVSGTTYSVTVTFGSSNTTITLQDSSGTLATKSITVTTGCSLSAPTGYGASGCSDQTFTLSAGPSVAGTIFRWYTTSSGGSPYTGDDDTYTTAVLSSTTTFYVSRFEASTGCESSRTSVTATITGTTPTVSSTPADICTGSGAGITLHNNIGSVLNTWTVSSATNVTGATNSSGTSDGSGNYSLNPTLSVTSSTADGTVVYQVTPSKSGCTGTAVNVTLNVKAQPTASAGADQTGESTCDLTSVTVSATTPSIGTGQWYPVTDDGYPTPTIAHPTLESTSVSGTAGLTYEVTWTVTNLPCPVAHDELLITFNKNPTTATAGSDQTSSSTCGLTTVTLAGNAPATNAGTGTWSVVSGSGTYSFSNTSSPTSTFTGQAGNSYTLRWTIATTYCGSTYDEVDITFNKNPTTAAAGPDQSICGEISTTLAANTPTVGTGGWIIVEGSGGTLGDASSPTSTFTGVAGTTYFLDWHITNSPCSSSDDYVNISFYEKPDVAASRTDATVCSGSGLPYITLTNPNSVAGTNFHWDEIATNVNPPTITEPGNHILGTYYNQDGLTEGTVVYKVYAFVSTCSSDSLIITIHVGNVPIAPNPSTVLRYTNTPAEFEVIQPDNAWTYWYDSVSGGTRLDSIPSPIFTNDSINESNIRYASFYDSISGCESIRAPITSLLLSTIPTSSVTAETIRVSGKTSDAAINPLNTHTEKSVMVTYVDGLGRAVQTLAPDASPSGDEIIQPVEYDSYGRTSKEYLPYVKAGVSTFQATYAADQKAFYGLSTSGDKIANDTVPYAVTRYELSSVGRALEQGKAGNDWKIGGGHTNRVTYSYNTGSDGDAVIIFTSDPLAVYKVGTTVQKYAANTLSRVQTTDENGNIEIRFYNSAGNVICKRIYWNANVTGVFNLYLDTYYVYDDFDRLRYVISPQAFSNIRFWSYTVTTAQLNDMIYQYVYDSKGRITQKKDPHKDWVYYCYDKFDRVVLVQDGNLRAEHKWSFVKYDRQSRAVMSGFYTNNTQTTLSAVQGVVDTLYSSGKWYEERGSASMGYTNQSFPTSGTDALTVNYFDDYDFDNNDTADYAYDSTHLSGLPSSTIKYTRGLPTGSKRKILNTSDWLVNVSFYDDYVRTIQSLGNNHLDLSVNEKASMIYDFEGKVTASKNHHDAGGSNQVDVKQTPVYEDRGRLIGLKHSINDSTDQEIAHYQYNELGQVVMKQLHLVSGSTYLQNVDFRYTINGWLSSINNASFTNDSGATNGDTNDFFGAEYLYNITETGGTYTLNNTAQYNGNVSAVKWKAIGQASGTSDEKAFTYLYDKANRLSSSSYKRYGTTGWDREIGVFGEALTFGLNGNVSTLLRSSLNPVTLSTQSIDNLSYTYGLSGTNPSNNSNDQVVKINDGTNLADGFADNGTNVSAEFFYDTNGNLIKDLNKKMLISYNELGKPDTISVTSPDSTRATVITYSYDVSGTKLKKVEAVTDSTGTTTTTTDYVDGFVYTNGALDFLSTAEGRVKKTEDGFEYQYSIADKQGNTRIVFTSKDPVATTITATFEDAAKTAEGAQFENYPSITPTATMDSGPSETQQLTGGTNSQVGVAKSLKVYPGDQVTIEADGVYTSGSGSSNLANFAAALLAAFGAPTPGMGEAGTISSGLNNWGGMIAANTGRDGHDTSHPKAFVNILIFDKAYRLLDAAFTQLTGSPEHISASYTIKQEGYAYMYISNESATIIPVNFDNVAISYTPSRVLQLNEYYAFGALMNRSWTREENKNDFLYDQGSELNTATGLYDLPYRNYDPYITRFFQSDPMSSADPSVSVYVYSGGDPVNENDPSGAVVNYADCMCNPEYAAQERQRQADMMNNAQYGNMEDWYNDAGPVGGSSGDMYSDALNVRSGEMSMEDFISKWNVKTYSGSGWGFSEEEKAQSNSDDPAANFTFEKAETAGVSKYPTPFTGQKANGENYFEGVRVFSSTVGDLEDGAAFTLPGIGIFVNPDDAYNVGLLRHEFGHVLQARVWGNSFFYKTIIPESLESANRANQDPSFIHQESWTEWTANYFSYNYFGQPSKWDTEYPTLSPMEYRRGTVPPMGIDFFLIPTPIQPKW